MAGRCNNDSCDYFVDGVCTGDLAGDCDCRQTPYCGDCLHYGLGNADGDVDCCWREGAGSPACRDFVEYTPQYRNKLWKWDAKSQCYRFFKL